MEQNKLTIGSRALVEKTIAPADVETFGQVQVDPEQLHTALGKLIHGIVQLARLLRANSAEVGGIKENQSPSPTELVEDNVVPLGIGKNEIRSAGADFDHQCHPMDAVLSGNNRSLRGLFRTSRKTGSTGCAVERT